VPVSIRNHPESSRYEVFDDDVLAGIAEYRLSGDRISFTHTETDPAFKGRGLATELVRGALDDARARGLAVLPFCPFVKDFLAENPDYLDLVPEDQRDRFALPA
jgi:uncharacterized protein